MKESGKERKKSPHRGLKGKKKKGHKYLLIGMASSFLRDDGAIPKG